MVNSFCLKECRTGAPNDFILSPSDWDKDRRAGTGRECASGKSRATGQRTSFRSVAARNQEGKMRRMFWPALKQAIKREASVAWIRRTLLVFCLVNCSNEHLSGTLAALRSSGRHLRTKMF